MPKSSKLMLHGLPYAKGASKYLTLKTLQKIIANNYSLENTATGVIQDYNPEEIKREYFVKCEKQAENYSKFADKKEKVMEENYYGTTLMEENTFTSFMKNINKHRIKRNIKELNSSKAVAKSCKRFIKKQNKTIAKGK